MRVPATVDGTLAILRPAGSLRQGRVRHALDAAVWQHVERGVRAFAIDCGAVERIDSGGVAFLLSLVQRLEPSGGRVVLFGLLADVRHVLEIAQLTIVIPIAETDQAARQRLLELQDREQFPRSPASTLTRLIHALLHDFSAPNGSGAKAKQDAPSALGGELRRVLRIDIEA